MDNTDVDVDETLQSSLVGISHLIIMLYQWVCQLFHDSSLLLNLGLAVRPCQQGSCQAQLSGWYTPRDYP